jgi:protein RecA
MASLASALGKLGIKNSASSAPSRWLDSGYPVLNHRMSGSYQRGFPMGRLIEIFGPPSAGKTVIATKAMVAAQQAGGVAIFMDHETSFDLRLGMKIGLSDDPDKWVYLQPDTFEESIDAVVEIIMMIRAGDFGVAPDAPIIVVWDSLASMIPKSKWDKDAADYNMNDTTALARATSAAFPALAKRITQNNVCGIFLNQARTSPGVMFGDPTTTPGGSAMEFYASIRLKLGGAKIYGPGEEYIDPKTKKKKKKTGATIGKMIGCETVKNKTHRPFEKCDWEFVFQADGSGKLDAVAGVIEELKSLGILQTEGAYIVWDGKKIYKKALVAKIEDEGLTDQLYAMLPTL